MTGNLWRYSGDLDEEDIEFALKDFFSISQGVTYYRIPEKRLRRIADQAGAAYKIDSKMIRIRRDVFEAYLRKHYL